MYTSFFLHSAVHWNKLPSIFDRYVRVSGHVPVEIELDCCCFMGVCNDYGVGEKLRGRARVLVPFDLRIPIGKIKAKLGVSILSIGRLSGLGGAAKASRVIPKQVPPWAPWGHRAAKGAGAGNVIDSIWGMRDLIEGILDVLVIQQAAEDLVEQYGCTAACAASGAGLITDGFSIMVIVDLPVSEFDLPDDVPKTVPSGFIVR